MGLTNSADAKLTLDDKLQFLQTKIQKQCTYHRKQAILFCSIPNCDKCPYLCNDCLREKIHLHQDGVYNQNQFIKALVTLLQVKKASELQKMKQSKLNAKPDYINYQKQGVKILQHIDCLQKQIQNIIGEYRKKIQIHLDRISKKINSMYEKQTNSLINFYINPNILACKLATQEGDTFLLNLKNQLKIQRMDNPKINEDQELSQLKSQLGTVKSKIRDLLNIANINHFGRKNSLAYSNINVALKKTFILPSDSPVAMSLSGSSMNILTPKDVFGVEVTSKEIRKNLSYPLNLISTRKLGEQFIGVFNQTKLIIFDGKNFNQLGLVSRTSSLGLLKGKRKMYGLIGDESGLLDIRDLEEARSIFSYRCGDQPIFFIQVNQPNSLICCAGKKTPIFIFRYKPKFMNLGQTDQLEFQYTMQINPNIVPYDQLQLMRLNNTQLYLFGQCRNICVFDLMLNTQITHTEYTRKCNPFIEAQFITINGADCLITLNQGQDMVNLWQIDKIKRMVKVEEIVKESNGRAIASIGCIRNELWVIRENQKNIDIFSVNME